jgi:two-component system, cell cycle sensor histidine kinase and response regulator CckA
MKSRFPSGAAAIVDAEAPPTATQRLSQHRAPIQQLADSNIMGILFSKSDGPIVDANDEFLRMVGYSREDLEAGRLDWINMTPPEWGVASRLARQQMEETGKARPFEKEFFRKDGTRVPILIGIVAVSQPDLNRVGFVVDLTERKQAERDLDRLMIERFAMLDSVGDGIYGLDMDGRCTFINSAAVRMLGYAPEECQGRNMDHLIHSKSAGGSAYGVETHAISGGVRKCEGVRSDHEVLWRKDGTSLVVEYSSYPIVVNGRVDGSLVSFKDIGERKKAEENLRASEERFRGAFANAAAGMCITDLEGRFLEVNQALCRMLGYGEAELLGARVEAVTHPEDLLTSDVLVRQLFRKEIPGFVAEKRYIKKDGGISWARCSVAVLADAAGAPARFVTIAEDITEQVKAKTDLRHTEELYRSIVENTQEGICMCDGDRDVTFCNQRLKTMLGYPEGGANFRCSDIHFEEDSEDSKRRFELRKTGVSQSYETRLCCADRTPLWVSASASPIPDDQGAFAGSLCMFTDVTARKRLEEQLRQAQKMEAVGQVAGGIAHDFNNLLTVILGYSAVLEQKLTAQDPLLKNVVEIKKAGEQAAALTQKLLAFSRKQVLRPRVISLNHLVRDMQAMLSRIIGEDVELVTELDPAVGNVKADPGQIEQVILNLTINARDAMQGGGKLLIESRRQDLDRDAAQLHSLPPGAYVLVTFTDNGCGIDESAKARIFEPFFTTKGPGVGTGLGLSTVLGIVNQSGGAIAVDSEVNYGTSFKIYLPLVEDAPSDMQSPQLPAATPAGEIILLVEDDDGIRGLARQVLEEHGYRVVEAASAKEAFRVAGLSPVVDLLLTDIVMGGMNGYELANQLSVLRPGMKILYMSGYSETGVVQQGMLEPGLNFLAKPFQPRELLWRIGEMLAKRAVPATLLIVDDDARVRGLLATLLESEGYSVSQASNGKEALARCHEALPDLVITDLVMPEQEGLETIHAICREWPHLPVIAISGAFGGAYLDFAKKLGADAVLRKPFEPDVILHEVRRLTGH